MEQMDVDLLISSPETQVELMNMMLQLQQLAELSDSSPCELQLPAGATAGGGGATFPGSPVSPPPAPGPLLSGSQSFCCFEGGVDAGGCGGGAGYASGTVAEEGASTAVMREMIFRIAAMQPVHVDPETVKPPRRRNVRISKDPQSVAARLRRERISERMRILQHMVPGGTKMDTASMLDEAIHYVKFLKTQVQSLERAAVRHGLAVAAAAAPPSSGLFLPLDGGANYSSCFRTMH